MVGVVAFKRTQYPAMRSWAHSTGALATIACFASVLTACNVITSQQEQTRDVADNVRGVDLQPQYPQHPTGDARATPAARASNYYGTVIGSAAPAAPQNTGEGFELHFENAPVVTVAKVVLGDILQEGYTIDPRVQGTVTLASGRPVPRSDLVYVLENALRLSNVALVRDQRGYRLIPASEAVGQGGVERATAPEPGFGITVIPLQYVSAQTLIKLLDSFAVKPGTVRADPSRNMLIVQGTGTERRNAVETAMSFDADWMRGQSVGIFPVRSSSPDPVIAELEKILDSGEGGLSSSMIKLQPIARQNAILVVAAKPELLRAAGTWISRLDRADVEATSMRVYHVRYGDARQMGALLNSMFVGGSGNALDSATNQLAPGGGAIVQSSGEGVPQAGLRISGGSTQGLSMQSSLGQQRPGGNLASQQNATRAGAAGATPGVGTGSGPALLQGVRITADTVNNTLLIYANSENYRIIERSLRELDRPQLQVAIDATIAEITLNETLRYGIQAFLKAGPDKGSVLLTQSTGASSTTDPTTGTVAGAATQALVSRILPGFNFLLGKESDPRFILDALRNITDVKVISTPSIVVVDNQVATLQVGDQVPVSTGTATVLNGANPIVSSIDYRNTGVILRVVPRINVNGNVLLDIEQEISNVNANANTLTPTVSQRRVKSSISVASGQTVLLAGLISERQQNTRSSIPLLDQLGEFGKSLGHTDKETQRTELIMFIRPQIIRDGVDASRVAEELRSKMRGNRVGDSSPLLPRTNPPGAPSLQPAARN